MPKRVVDPKQRRVEILVAALFLLTAVTSIYGVTVLDPILNSPDYLAQVFPNKTAVVWGSLLWSINNIGIVFIAVAMFPILRELDELIAVGYLASRIIEGTIMMVGIAATLLLIPLSQEFLKAGAPQASSLQTLGDILKQAKFLGLTELSLPMLGLGGTLFTWQLLRHGIVPMAISAVGLIGYVIVFFGGVAGWFGLVDTAPGGSGTFLAIPVALFEIILLPFWLLFRGFSISNSPALP